MHRRLNRTRWRASATTALLAVTAAFHWCFTAAPVAEAQGGKQLRIQYLAVNLAFPFQAFIAREAEDEGKRLGVSIHVTDGTGSSPKQSSDLRNGIVQGVDGMVLNANDVNALIPAVNEVIAANIPIVSIDSAIGNTSKPVPYFGPDNVAGGAKMAQYVIDHCPNGAKIVLLTGQPGSGPSIERSEGILKTLKAADPKYKLVANQTANWSRAQGLTVTQNILTSLGTPPDAILSCNDDMALGALAALHQSGVSKGKVMVIGYDALPETLKSIRDGDMTATLDQLPGQQVRHAIDALVANLRDHKPLEGVKLDPVLIDKTNLEQAGRFKELK